MALILEFEANRQAEAFHDKDELASVGLLNLSALIVFAGMGLQTFSYTVARAGEATIMLYVEIPYTMALQGTFFHQRVSGWMGVGAAAVAVAGLLVLRARVG